MFAIHVSHIRILFLILLIVYQSFGQIADNETINRELHDNYVNSGVDSTLSNFLQYRLSDVLRKGNKTLGLPIFDPFLKDKFVVHVDYEDVVGRVEFNDLKIYGVSNYIVRNASLSLVSRKLIFGLDFSKIHAESFYTLNGFVNKNINFFGDGRINMTATGLSVSGILEIYINDEMSIKSMDLEIHLDAIHVNTTGLFHDAFVSEILSKLAETTIPRLIVEYQKNVTSVIVEWITGLLKILLKGTTIGDFIHVGWKIFLRKISLLRLDSIINFSFF